MLNKHDIFTALDFKKANDAWVKKKMTVVGLRTLYELRGTSCIALELQQSAKKNICTSRSFSTPVFSMDDLSEAISIFTANAVRKLREQQSCTAWITVLVQTNRFNQKNLYYNSQSVNLPTPTDSTLRLIHYALGVLRTIYKRRV
jgi:DNA polymerase V